MLVEAVLGEKGVVAPRKRCHGFVGLPLARLAIHVIQGEASETLEAYADAWRLMGPTGREKSEQTQTSTRSRPGQPRGKTFREELELPIPMSMMNHSGVSIS